MIEKEIINFERTVIVGIVTQNQDEEKLKEYLDELEFLTFTAGGEVIKRFSQKMDKPNPKTFVGTGKLEEIAIYIKENDISTIIFDDELTPSQSKNITKIFDIKVLDRTNLILDIFAQRAQTSYARTQVELAQCIYLLPRLSGMWTHLERQRGGIGMRGPGETEIETDRRIVRDRIALLKDKIKAIDKQMAEDGAENFTNEVQNLNTTTLEVDFDMVMAEFNELTQGYMAQDPAYYGPRIVEIVERHLGKGNKVGDCSRDQAQVIDLIVYDLKEIKK